MVTAKYIPERGDIIWLNFDSAKGHEQRGDRPAFVISPRSYNEKTDMALVCPITSSIKSYPLEELLETKELTGAILVDQIRCVDWSERNASFIVKTEPDLLQRVLRKVRMLTE